jgi:SAM-dependent MidA family methyltransferase
MSDIADAIMADIGRHGPIPFDRVVERALYDPDGGFYEVGGRAGGRHGDFLTSPEVGGLFGAVVARAIDAWWDAMGRPDPYVVVEAGAGPGTLCRTVLAARPRCAPTLRYVLVERSAAQRRRHGEKLPLEDPALAFPPVDPDTSAPVVESPSGPICVSLAELPRLAGPTVVLANELLDNLPFGLAERDADGWAEVRVDRAGDSAGATRAGPRLVERLVPLDAARAEMLDRLVPAARPGARVPLQDAARAWLRDALALAGVGPGPGPGSVAASGGRVVTIDYAATTAELAERPVSEWLRTYRSHARGSAPLDALGAQDVTCEVAVDQLALVRPPTSDTTQAAWLHAHGIKDLVAEARSTWTERAHIGDLAALSARSRVAEADALLDSTGLGGFRVLEWEA